MYKLLLKNRITNSAILVGLLLVLRSSLLWNKPETYDGPSGLLYQEWFGSIEVQGGWIWIFLILVLQLYVLLDFTLRYKISSEASLIPGLTFVLFVCLIPEFQTFHPIIFANTFLLFALRELFGVSPRQASGKAIFNSGLWLALATLFYSSFFLFVVAIVSGINILRSWRYNDIKILVIGFVTPLFLLGVYYFWFDRFDVFSAGLFSSFGWLSFRTEFDPFLLGVGLIVLANLVNVIVFNARVMTKKTIIKQNYFKIIYWTLFCCLLQMIFQEDIGIEHLMILTLPLSLLLAEYLINWKASKSILMINLALILIVLFQFKDYLIALF